MESRLTSEPVAADDFDPATGPAPDATAGPTPDPTDDADDLPDDEIAEGHADPDADRDFDAEPPEHELPPETDPAMTFADLQLMRPLLEAVTHAGYVHPTPVQEAVIPVAMRGKDVIGQAQTGTGKTAAFLLPFMNRWRPHNLKGPIGLVMTPTRELALQVATEAETLAPSRRFRTVAVYGGARMGKQLEGLARGCDLVVGTPGRMLDHLRRGSMTLNDIKFVVLDEADRMLDIGFRPDIERILKRCPLARQTLLMSATVPDPIKRLVHRYMTDPVHLQLTPNVPTVEKIRQSYFTVDAEKKFDLLLKVIDREKPRQGLIFVERKRWADNLYRDLKRAVRGAAVIHGDLPQSQREKIMAAFRTGDIKFLIATDVMSRGIDVDDLSHVINFDLPQDIESYVHRIGRTGRIGRDGIAISFVTPEQGGLLTEIEVMINKLIEADSVPGEWYTSKRVSSMTRPTFVPTDPAVQVAKLRDDSGWGVDEEDVRGGKLGVAEGEAAPRDDDAPPAAAEKKPILGKHRRRYSNRL
ncbi:MAG: DEAD/DEAH box helicase [Gemmataceae bacterium]|nr:DEAD/DEAH box helicase [Gemmataceae bacterium]